MKEKIKLYFNDLFYSVFGLVFMNGMLQIAVYPYLTKQLGADRFGNILTVLSVISIMASTFGTGANYSRMLFKVREQDVKGDYNIFLLGIAVLSIPVTYGSLIYINELSPALFVGTYVLMVISVLRYYSDVEFRLVTNYKRFCLYYLLISAGYLVGILFYPLTGSWVLVILLGESAAVGYVIWKGTIYSRPIFRRSPTFRTTMTSVLVLSMTDFIAALILNLDRIILQYEVGGTGVTIFYAATLVGKIAALISTPLNGVVIGHLSKYKGKLAPTKFAILCVTTLVAGFPLGLVCVFGSHIFIKSMYSDIYEIAKQYFWIANLGEIYYFLSGVLLTVLLRFTGEKAQLKLNIVYLVIFMALAIPLAHVYQLAGMAYALLISNIIRIVIIMVSGMVMLRKRA